MFPGQFFLLYSLWDASGSIIQSTYIQVQLLRYWDTGILINTEDSRDTKIYRDPDKFWGILGYNTGDIGIQCRSIQGYSTREYRDTIQRDTGIR